MRTIGTCHECIRSARPHCGILPDVRSGTEPARRIPAQTALTQAILDAIAARDAPIDALRKHRVCWAALRHSGPELAEHIAQRVLNEARRSTPKEARGCDNRLAVQIETLIHTLSIELGSMGTESAQQAPSKKLSSRRSHALLGATAFAWAAIVPLPSFAVDGPDPFAGLQLVSADVLANHRGGFFVNGVDVNFGAVVKTVVNGTEVLETQFNATDQGMVVTQSGPATLTSSPVIGAPQLKVSVVNGSSTSVGSLVSGNAAPVPSGNASGVLVSDPSGNALAISTINPISINNAVISNASNQSIKQQIEVNIALQNFSSVQQQVLLGKIGATVSSSVQAALSNSLAH